MSRPTLSKAPLQEAIFEFRWELQPDAVTPEIASDPNYKLFVGRFFDRIRERYPHHETLPSAAMPDEMVAYSVQHRFREGKNLWPLVQVGPGVLSLNQTKNFEAADFKARCVFVIETFLASYPDISKLKPHGLSLRFINNLSTGDSDYSEFLAKKMKVSLGLPGTLFNSGQVEPKPKYINFASEYFTTDPKGIAAIRFETVILRSTQQKMIKMESTVLSQNPDIPSLPDGIGGWVGSSHKIIEDWFFAIIDGEILEELR